MGKINQKNQSNPSGNSSKDNFFIKSEEKGKTNENKVKKPFNKREWRMKKYSNKYKLDKWEDQRKKRVLHQYHKVVKRDNTKGFDVQKIYEQEDVAENSTTTATTTTNNDTKPITQEVDRNDKTSWSKFKKLHDKKAQLEKEKLMKKEEISRKKKEKEEALALYKQKKMEKFKKLNKKTKKGQPIMKDRLEMLYEKIKETYKVD